MKPPKEKERVPLFGTWKIGYRVVLGLLAILIVIFYWVTKHFS